MSPVRDCAVATSWACDYSHARGAVTSRSPHDLVWFSATALADDIPPWARDVIAAGEPAVVRRGPRDGTSLPIGIRGDHRGARHGTRIACGAVTAHRCPEALIAADSLRRLLARPGAAAFSVLKHLVADDIFDHLCWGVTGALGYELATGVAATRAGSDVDLLVRMPFRDDARLAALAARLADRSAATGVRIDVALETPTGGVALLDWIGPAEKVLVKTDTGPRLLVDPWDTADSPTRDGAKAGSRDVSDAAPSPAMS